MIDVVRHSILRRWTCDQQVVGSTPGRHVAEQRPWARRSHSCPALWSCSIWLIFVMIIKSHAIYLRQPIFSIVIYRREKEVINRSTALTPNPWGEASGNQNNFWLPVCAQTVWRTATKFSKFFKITLVGERKLLVGRRKLPIARRRDNMGQISGTL